jgi:hypothetical protein
MHRQNGDPSVEFYPQVTALAGFKYRTLRGQPPLELAALRVLSSL